MGGAGNLLCENNSRAIRLWDPEYAMAALKESSYSSATLNFGILNIFGLFTGINQSITSILRKSII